MFSVSVFWVCLVLLLSCAFIIKYSWKKCFLIPFPDMSFQLCISVISSPFFPFWHKMLPLPVQKIKNFVSSINLFLKEWAQMDQHPDLHLSVLDELCLTEAHIDTYQEIPASIYLLNHAMPIISYWIEKCVSYKSYHFLLSLQMCESVSSVKTTNKRSRPIVPIYIAIFW